MAVGAAGLTTLGPTASAATPSFRDDAGLHVLSVKARDSRLRAVSVSTAALRSGVANPAISGPANVRILLPTGYGSHPHRRYPVLYLLHGTSGGAADWTTQGGAEATTSGWPLIVVMPDIALSDTGGGWCTNWVNGGRFGAPQWERFHIAQLIPWIDHNLRTIATRSGRAIAGLSQGGFCSMSYAARHPDLFATALSFSGAPDIAYDAQAIAPSTTIINATELALDHVPADSMFGSRTTDEVNWADHDPATLAENLRGIRLLLYTGNGTRGPLDTAPNGEASSIETLVHEDTLAFHQRLVALGIPSYLDDYGPGTHSWPYWARDLRQSIGTVMADFVHPPRPPAAVRYTTADPSYTVFGWTVTMRRTATEFSTLQDASARGFTVRGSGSASVLTPPAFRPGARYRVVLSGGTSGSRTLTAARSGRLTIALVLGPANPYQQFTALAVAAGTHVYATRVRISAA